jgi:hypothetical protein
MRLLCLSVLLSLTAAVCNAQAGRAEVRGDVGWTGFLDEGSDDHLLVGASLRAYLSRRVSVQPEFQYLTRSNGSSGKHNDLVLVGNVAFDFTSPGSRVVPYVVGGPGVMHTSESLFSTTEWFVSGGGGVKIFLADRWYVAPEFRVGWEPHVRFSVGVGYVWRR